MLNSSFLQSVRDKFKFLTLSVVLVVMTSCTTLQTRRGSDKSAPSTSSGDVQTSPGSPSVDSSTEPSSPVVDFPSTPTEQIPVPPSNFKEIRLGVILGPGGAKTYGHIGVLKELQKRRIPIMMIAGVEWAALPAALFASKGYVNDVEWQMMKMKESEWFTTSILSSKKLVSLGETHEDLNKIFAGTRVESFKHQFVCPAWNMEKKQTYLMQKGALLQLLPFCLGFPPLFQPYQKNVAGMADMKSVTDHMRSKGVNYILFINVLDQAPMLLVNDDLGSSVAWSTAMSQYQKQRNGIDEVIGINLKEFQLRDFSKKREIMNKSVDLAPKAIGPWAQKLGF